MRYDIPDEFKAFVNNVKRRCKAHRVELMLCPSRTVVLTDSYTADCDGYFDDTDKVLVVACGKPFEEWIEILVHEYSHMEQWLSDKRWKRWIKCCEKLWAWMDDEIELTDAQVNDIVDGMIELERDCELRAMFNIQKWMLPINRSMYMRKANLYLYSYRMLPEVKRFPKGIYDNKELIKLCKPRIYKKYDKIPDDIRERIESLYK
jgi:hypothetical protein